MVEVVAEGEPPRARSTSVCDGTFHFADVPAGEYAISLICDLDHLAPEKVVVVAGQTATVKLTGAQR